MDQYDVVTDILCLVSACATREDCTAALVRLHALLKPGGKIVLYTPERKEAAFYPVGSLKFFDLGPPREFILKSLEQAGFFHVKLVTLRREELKFPEDYVPEVFGVSFITASKMN